jgi:hypothetical protein
MSCTFFSPSRDELEWASDATDCDEHLLALLLMLKSYRRMERFPALEDVPEMVVDFVRRAGELPEGTLPAYRAAKAHRGLVRKRAGVTYDQARGIVEQSIRNDYRSRRHGCPDVLNGFRGIATAIDRKGVRVQWRHAGRTEAAVIPHRQVLAGQLGPGYAMTIASHRASPVTPR